MSHSQTAKLANTAAHAGATDESKSRFNNGKKQLTGPAAHSARARKRCGSEDHEIRGSAAGGTRRALKDKVLGAAQAGAPVPKIARNRRGRRSTALRLSEVRNIIAAGVFTAKEHRALNRHTTVHFDAAGIADPVAALRAYMKLARDWLRTQGAPFSYIWVRESGEEKGEHAHILMHVPARLAVKFARRERGWRKRIGAKPARGAFLSTAIGRSYRHAEVGSQYGQAYSDALAGMIGYLVKGAELHAVKALGLNRVEPGGELWGKRSGTSENIGRSARQIAIK